MCGANSADHLSERGAIASPTRSPIVAMEFLVCYYARRAEQLLFHLEAAVACGREGHLGKSDSKRHDTSRELQPRPYGSTDSEFTLQESIYPHKGGLQPALRKSRIVRTRAAHSQRRRYPCRAVPTERHTDGHHHSRN